MHWAENSKRPEWSPEWIFEGELPNHNRQGCYALFSEDEIIYIGVGIGKGSGQYKNNGIGYRTKRYWCLNKDENRSTRYAPTSDWEAVGYIRTIGFEPEDAYLAAALEIYLIERLDPPRNSQHKRA